MLCENDRMIGELSDDRLNLFLTTDRRMLERLLGIKPKRIPKLCKKIAESAYLQDQESFARLFRILLQAAEARYTKIQYVVDLTEMLYATSSSFKQMFGELVEWQFLRVSGEEVGVPWFRYIYFCMTQFLYTSEEIVELLRKFRQVNPALKNRFAELAAWFLPQLKRIDPVLYEEAMSIGKELNSAFPVSDVYQKEGLDVDSLDDWIYNEFEPDTVGVAIKTDDAAMLKRMIVERGVLVDSPMPRPVFAAYRHRMDSVPLVAGAAFYGSVNVFKFLILNGARLMAHDDGGADLHVIEMACCSGKHEIVRICQENRLLIWRGAENAVYYHHYNLYNWITCVSPPGDGNGNRLLEVAAVKSGNFMYLQDVDELEDYHDLLAICCQVDNVLLLRWIIFMFGPITDRELCMNLLHVCVEKTSPNCLVWVLDQIKASPDALEFKYDRAELFEKACRIGSLFVVNALWQAGIRSKHAMFEAGSSGHTRIVERLCELGLDDIVDPYTESNALREAAKAGYADTVRALLKLQSISSDLLNGDKSPLLLAIKGHKTEVVRVLLDDKRVKVTEEAILAAAGAGHSDGLLEIMRRSDMDVNCQFNGETPLSRAVKVGSVECVDSILSAFTVDVNAIVNPGETVLHIAARQGLTEIVKRLVAVPSLQVNQADRQGMTALHYAAETGREDIVSILFEQEKIEINTMNHEKKTPIYYAIRSGCPTIVQKFLAHPSINLNCQDADGRGPLHILCMAGGYDIALSMIQRSNPFHLNFEAVDKNNWTGLHHAARHGHDDIARLLLFVCPQLVNRQTSDKYTALHLACMYKQLDCVRVIMDMDDTQPNLKTIAGVCFLFTRPLFTLLLSMGSLKLSRYLSRTNASIRQYTKFFLLL